MKEVMVDTDRGFTRSVSNSDEADLKEHERMGFHEGWSKAAGQLEALAKSL